MVGAYVIYLAWPPLGLGPLERFASSYREHPAGTDHRLVLVLKGAAAGDPFAERCSSLAAELGAEQVRVPAVGIDLDTYRLVGGQVSADRVCLLNSSSTVLADGWLGALQGALDGSKVGLVGCTGTYESALSAAPRPLQPFLRRRYVKFPNPHIRTNAFMLRRDLMLDLDWPHRVGGKRRALELESGARGITRQVRARGLRALVVGRDGRGYPPEQWPVSRTFRSGTQDNLLIADNRTRQYDDAAPDRRAELAGYAWGRGAQITDLPPVATRPV